MLSDSEAAELLSFLTPDTRPDVKGQATEYILGLSGNRQEEEEEEDDNGDGDGDDDTVDNVDLNSCTNYRLFLNWTRVELQVIFTLVLINLLIIFIINSLIVKIVRN